jgi:dihydrofolate reductase
MYPWLDRAPKGRNETGVWWRRHDEYEQALRRVVGIAEYKQHPLIERSAVVVLECDLNSLRVDDMKVQDHAVPECAVFVGVSLDGFIARPNGDLDWLIGDGGGDSAEYGYNEFIAGIDAIVMGRKTFEQVLTFDKWHYGNKRVVVLSTDSIDLSLALARGGVVERMAGPPAEIASKLAASGARHLYVDGGATIQQFLRAGLINRLIISRLPVLIGEGIPLFGSLPQDIRLAHIATRTYPGGMVQSEYHIGE